MLDPLMVFGLCRTLRFPGGRPGFLFSVVTGGPSKGSGSSSMVSFPPKFACAIRMADFSNCPFSSAILILSLRAGLSVGSVVIDNYWFIPSSFIASSPRG
ncbi:hypothetical protein HID58_039928 [Brassica napus]|uniref:Secreted protein n=1 Tax=Brassica napus TaxID=3708 RepID=A0ABQ8B6K0_BRANA|nr:hypothetical protein HID58_039928 [Brassica napus]